MFILGLYTINTTPPQKKSGSPPASARAIRRLPTVVVAAEDLIEEQTKWEQLKSLAQADRQKKEDADAAVPVGLLEVRLPRNEIGLAKALPWRIRQLQLAPQAALRAHFHIAR